jgi:four helix bundle protein
MHNFRNLHIWDKARVIVKESYQLTNKFPQTEIWGLTNQIRRASISVSSNIAEGSGKSSNKDFTRFLEIAISSCFELETQFILAFDLGYILETEMSGICNSLQEEQKMIYNFIQTLQIKN